MEIITSFLDNLVNLWVFRQEKKMVEFEYSVTILFEELEIIHKNYMESFREYKFLLNNNSCDISKLIDQICEERTFSQSNRTKLQMMTESLSNLKNDEYNHFYELILSYLSISHIVDSSPQYWFWIAVKLLWALEEKPQELSESDWEVIGQIPMLRHLNYKLFNRYLENASVEKNMVALRIIEVLVESMQIHYKNICQEYAQLQAKFLENYG